MSQARVWRPDDAEPEKPKQQKKQNKSQKQSKQMANQFWDKHIQSGKTVSFCLLDDTELQAKIVGRDAYHIIVEVDGKEQMIFKHSIKCAEEA